MKSTFYHLKGFNLKGELIAVWSRSLSNARYELRSKGVWRPTYAVKVAVILNLDALKGGAL